jgi:fibronectin-binding autotransporter adhesin
VGFFRFDVSRTKHTFCRRTLPAFALIGAFFAVAPQLVFATNTNWTGATTTWSTGSNWSTGSAPGAPDNAVFNGTFSNQPSLTATALFGGIWMTGSIGQNVTISASSGTLQLNSNTINGTAGLGILIDNSNAFTLTISAPMKVGNAETWTNNSGNLFTVGAGGVDTNSKALTINGTGNTTISGVVSNGGSLTKSGTGTLTLSGANTYTGTTTVSAGILNIQNATALGAPAGSTTVSSGATLQLQGVITVGADALTISGTGASGQNGALVNVSGTNNYGGLLTLGAATTISSDSGTLNLTNVGTITGATFGLTLTGSGNGSISSIIGTTSGALTKNGSGTWTLSGANTYTGKTSIQNSALSVSSLNKVTGGSASSSLGAPTTVANGTIDIGSTTTSGTLIYTGSGETTDRVINLAGTTGGAVFENDGSGAVTFSSNLTATGAGSKTFTLQGSNAGSNTISGVIVDNTSSNTTSVTKAGAGTWVLSGVNTYTGGTTINAGTLQLGNANTSSGGALGKTTSASVTFGAGSTGKLQLNGNATTIIDLNTNATVGTPIIENGSSTATAILTVNTANTDTYAGLLQDGSSQTLGLTKSGSGTLILTGLTNSQTGITIINGGILRASDITTYAAGNQNITSSILGQAANNGVAFSGNNATLQLRYNGQSDSTSQTLTLLSTKGGALLVNASAPNATIDVDRQGGSGTNKTIAFTSSTIASSSTLNVTGADGYSLGLGNLVVGSGGSAGNATVNPTTANLTIGTTTSSGTTFNHTLVLDGTSSGNTITGAMADGGGSSVLSVTKQNTSSWTLSGASTYTGATTVNAGSLFVNGSTASGSAVTVNNSGSTLGGSGTINGSINVASAGANLSPGASGVGITAILHTGAVTLASGSNFNVDINGTTAGTGYDQVSVTGAVNLGGLLASNLVVTAGSSLSIGQKFYILLNDSTDTVSGTFAQGTTVTASNNGDVFLINYADNGDGGILGNDISLTVTALPEPSTYVAGILTLAALGYQQRRRWLHCLPIRRSPRRPKAGFYP